MAAAASIPTSLVRLPLWHAGLTPRPIASFACSVARGLVRGGERESSHFVRGIDWGAHERGWWRKIARQNAALVERNIWAKMSFTPLISIASSVSLPIAQTSGADKQADRRADRDSDRQPLRSVAACTWEYAREPLALQSVRMRKDNVGGHGQGIAQMRRSTLGTIDCPPMSTCRYVVAVVSLCLDHSYLICSILLSWPFYVLTNFCSRWRRTRKRQFSAQCSRWWLVRCA